MLLYIAEAMEFFGLTEGTIVTLSQSDKIEIRGLTIHITLFPEWAIAS
ncbi:MAG: hypothetical protein KKA07_01695 [Bacteroidetes bacterium]|nr:hypothetical protein [Bacteroidota bacterium]MBU1717763.1 hypothetical protein [Bacteroidota bacterium]